jgi:DNA invertase Pin-like site-specific DNA recombinase
MGTNLADVVSFYLSHQNTTVGQKTVSEVLEEFLREKLQVGRSKNYERNMRKCFSRFLKTTGEDRKIGEITRRQISDYVYVTHGHLSNVSKKNLLTNFSVLLNYNDRPQLTLALNECRRQKATLVVAKLDRLSRNAEFLLRLQNGNVDFVCCDCPNVDRFTVGILALVAQRERELISERTKSALQAAKKRGVQLGTKNPDRQVRLMMEVKVPRISGHRQPG